MYECIYVCMYICTKVRAFVKVRLAVCLYKPGLQEVEAPPRVSRQSAHKGGKVVSPTHRPPLTPPPGDTTGINFCQ